MYAACLLYTSAEAQAEETAKEEAENTSPENEGKDTEAPEKAAKEDAAEDESTRYLRLMADFQNYKKRVEKEKKDLYSYANEKLVTEQLEVLDNFERALEQETSDENFKKGMELSLIHIYAELIEAFCSSQVYKCEKMLYVTVHASVRQQPQQMERGVVFLHMLYGFKESRILKEIPVFDGLGDECEILIYYPACAYVEMADFRAVSYTHLFRSRRVAIHMFPRQVC